MKTRNDLAPINEEAELAVLVCVRRRPEYFSGALENWTEEYFQIPANRIIWNAMRALFQLHGTIDFLALKKYLAVEKLIHDAGGEPNVERIFTSKQYDLKFACGEVVETYRKRLMQTELYRLQDIVVDPARSLEDIKEEAAISLAKITMGAKAATRTLYEIVNGTVEGIEKRMAQGNGKVDYSDAAIFDIEELDEYLQGIRAGDYTVLSGGTSSGKSALALQLARKTAIKGIPVLYFSLEMSAEKNIQRALSQSSGINLRDLVWGNIKEWQSSQWGAAVLETAHLPMHIDDQTNQLDRIVAKIRTYAAQKEIKLVVIDYLQLVKIFGRHENRQVAVAEMSSTFKRLAQELKIAIVVLSQINADGATRESQAPLQDADIALRIETDKDDKSKKDIYVGKARSNEAGHRVPVKFSGATVSFAMADKSATVQDKLRTKKI